MRAPQKPLLVLLVEDDDTDLLLLRRVLEELPFVQRVIVAPDAERAINYLQGGRSADRATIPLPGLLILDQRLPGLSGLDMLCWVRSDPRLAFLPAILLSGHLSPAQIHQAARLRAEPCVKSVPTDEMPAVLSRAIQNALGRVRQAWFDSKAAYISAYAPVSGLPAQIRVWT